MMRGEKQNSQGNVQSLILENVPEIIYFVETNGDPTRGSVKFVSPSVEGIVGYTRDEFTKNPALWVSIIHPDDVPAVQRTTEEMFAKRKRVCRQYRIRHKVTGEYIWIEDTPSLITDGAGKITGYIGVAREAELAQRKSDQKFKALFDGFPLPTYTWQLQGDQIVLVGYNVAASRVVGQYVQQLLGRSARDIYTDRPDILEDFERCLSTKETFHREISYRFPISGDVRELAVDYVFVPPDKIMVHTDDITERKRAEEEARQSEFWITESQRVARIGSYVLDLKTGYWTSSDILDEIFGIDRNYNRSTEGWSKLVHPEQRLEMVEYFEKDVIAHGAPFVKDYRIVRPSDGQERWVSERGELVYDEKGNLLKMFGTIQDITERKRAEQELQKLSRAVEQTADIVFITDRNGLIEYVNPAFEKTTGYRREEVIGKTPRIIKSGEHPESFYERLWKTILEGLPFRSVLINKKKDGTTFYEEKTITPLRAEDGTITHFVSTGKDVTERMKAAELLRQTEEKARLVLSNMHEVVYSIRSEDGNFLTGTVDFVNDRAEDLLGFGAKEFMMNPRLWLELLHPEDLAAVQESTERLLTDKIPITRVYRIKHKHTGMYRWMEDHVVPHISVVDNKVIGIFGVARDITERKQGQEQIAMLAHALKSIGECVSITDKDNAILFVNEAFLKTYGYDEHELLGKHISVVRSPNNLPEVVHKILPATLRGGWRGELLNRRKDGGEFPIFLSTSVVRDDKGQPLALIGVAADITERKRVQEILRESEDRYRDLVEHSQDLFCTHDLEGRILSANPWAAKVLGYEIDTILQMNIRDFLAPEARGGVDTYLAKIQKRGAANGRLPIQTATGERRIWEYNNTLRIEGVATPIVRGMARDITERKRAEEALRESEEQHRELVENINDVIFIVDAKGVITYISPIVEILGGYKASELIGKPFTSFIHDEDLAMVQKAFNRAIFGSLEPAEYRAKTVWGQTRWVRSSSKPIQRGGEIVGVRGVLTDITERKLVEERMQQYGQRLQVLSKKLLEIQENERRHIAHELHDEIGQALTSLKILLEMNTKANVDTAKQNLNDALGITGDLILRIRGLSLDLRPHMLDDLGLVPAVRWHLLHRTEKMGIEAHFKAEPEEILVSGEIKTTCFRVAQEALTNVLKHSKAKSVEVQLTKRGSNLELAIRDDGRGFDVESAFQHSASGESFGLLGMQERARFAGGALVIRSEQGRGSEIKATFPNAFVPSPTNNGRSADR